MEKKEEDKLLTYFMGQTNERLTQIELKLVELIAFRAEVMAQAKAMAMWVSIVAGLFSVLLNYLLRTYAG